MYDSPEKSKINVDELVNQLMKGREAVSHTAKPAVPAPEPEEDVRVYTPEKAAPVEEAPEEDVKIYDPSAKEAQPDPEPVPEPEEQAEPIPEPDSTPEPEPDGEQTKETPKKKRGIFGVFGRKKQETEADEESWNDWGLKPIGHYNSNAPEPETAEAPEQAHPSELGVDEFPEVKAVADTITMQIVLPSGEVIPRKEKAEKLDQTRVVPDLSEVTDKPDAEAKPVDEPETEIKSVAEQLPDQLSLEEMVRVEDIEPTEDMPSLEDQADPEERLQRAREEKVREFTLNGDEEEENEPEEESQEEEEEPVIEDYSGYEDTKAVASELLYRQRTALVTLVLTGVLEVAMLLLTMLTLGGSPMTGVGYLSAQLFMLVLMIGLNYSAVGRGWAGLFTLKANSDSAPALASAVALAEVLLHIVPSTAELPYGAPLAGVLMVLCAAGHYAQAVGVRRNFAFVSYPGEKYAATLIEEENAAQEIGRRAAGTGEATVGYFHRTGFLTDYLSNAYDPHRGDEWSRFVTPIAFVLSILLSLVALLGEGTEGFWGWLTVFVTMVCVSMQVTQIAVQFPLNQCARVMLSRGGFLVGWKAVRQFGNLDALVVDIADLYPDESMLLHGIKTFSGTHIDEAILTAASLTVRAGGPLSMIFRRIIENKEELLSEVDTLVYEQGMGLSGWVDGRRVLVGNRRLLQNHAVDVPSSDYEARYAKNGRRLVYLSMGGQLSAMFVVSYLPDPEIQEALQDLGRSQVTLLVRSCDPNIGTQDLCESFELEEYYVDVLPAAAGRAYVQLAERTSDSMPAVMASNGHILGTAWALSVCRSLRTKSHLALVVQTLFAAVGLVSCLMWALQSTLSLLQPLALVLAGILLTVIVPLFKRT